MGGLIFTALLLSSIAVRAEKETKNQLDDMTLLEFIRYVSKRLDNTVIISPRVRNSRKETMIYTPHNLSDKELRDTFLAVLKVYGYGVVEVDGVLKIVALRSIRSMPLPVLNE